MQSFRIVHEYETTPDAFWSLFFDAEYCRDFYAAVDIDFELLRDESDGVRRERVIRYRSQKPVPAPLRPFLPNGLGYVERASFDYATFTYEHRIEPVALASRTEIVGTLRAEALPGGRMRRVYAGQVSIHVPLLGARLETDTIASMTKAQHTAAVVTRTWLARQSAVAPASSVHESGALR